jgi:hypothetical protein
VQRSVHFICGFSGRGWPGDNVHIPVGGKILPASPETLPYQTLRAVTDDGIAHPPGYGHPEPWSTKPPRKIKENEIVVLNFATVSGEM